MIWPAVAPDVETVHVPCADVSDVCVQLGAVSVGPHRRVELFVAVQLDPLDGVAAAEPPETAKGSKTTRAPCIVVEVRLGAVGGRE